MLQTLFALLLQYFGSVAREPEGAALAGRLARPLYDLMATSTAACVDTTAVALDAMTQEFEEVASGGRSGLTRFPDLDVVRGEGGWRWGGGG